MSTERTFKLGQGSVMLIFILGSIGGLVGVVIAVSAREWSMMVVSALGFLTSATICFWLPGKLKLDATRISIERRRGSQSLRWDQVTSAVWTGSGTGIAALASDNWVVTIKGESTTIVLSGPMVEKQAEVRSLLQQQLRGKS